MFAIYFRLVGMGIHLTDRDAKEWKLACVCRTREEAQGYITWSYSMRQGSHDEGWVVYIIGVQEH